MPGILVSHPTSWFIFSVSNSVRKVYAFFIFIAIPKAYLMDRKAVSQALLRAISSIDFSQNFPLNLGQEFRLSMMDEWILDIESQGLAAERARDNWFKEDGLSQRKSDVLTIDVERLRLTAGEIRGTDKVAELSDTIIVTKMETEQLDVETEQNKMEIKRLKREIERTEMEAERLERQNREWRETLNQVEKSMRELRESMRLTCSINRVLKLTSWPGFHDNDASNDSDWFEELQSQLALIPEVDDFETLVGLMQSSTMSMEMILVFKNVSI